MLRKDYIMRQFEEFGKVMAVIFGLKLNKDWEQFEMEIGKAVNRFTSLQMGELIEKDEEAFVKFITNNKDLKPDQIKILADLLYEQSFVFGEKEQNAEMITVLKKAGFLYQLYKENLTENDFNLEVHYRIELIKRIILRSNPQ